MNKKRESNKLSNVRCIIIKKNEKMHGNADNLHKCCGGIEYFNCAKSKLHSKSEHKLSKDSLKIFWNMIKNKISSVDAFSSGFFCRTTIPPNGKELHKCILKLHNNRNAFIVHAMVHRIACLSLSLSRIFVVYSLLTIRM